MPSRNAIIRARIDFTYNNDVLLTGIARRLHIAPSHAVEYAFEYGFLHLFVGALFFDKQIEKAPGSRLAYEDLNPNGRSKALSNDEFAEMGHLICDLRKIDVRMRGNQVVCVDVRLRA